MSKENHDILSALRDRQHDVYKDLYKNNYASIERYIVKNSGSIQDAEDIFQDGLLILFKKAQDKYFSLTVPVNTYFFAICKKLWLKRLRTKSKKKELLLNDDIGIDGCAPNIAGEFSEDSYFDKFIKLMSRLSAHCYELLHLMIFKNRGIREIQKLFGYTTKHNAQNQKYRCMEQAKNVVNPTKKKK